MAGGAADLVGVRLRVLLDHVELAGYNRELVNWRVEEGCIGNLCWSR